MPDFDEDIASCLPVLRDGGIILYPTDTIWGLGCDATNSESVKKIFAIKNRDSARALIVLVGDEKDIRRYVAAHDPAVFNYLAGVSNATTVVYEGAIGLAPELIAEDGSVGIRLVKNDFCRHLIKRFKKPIVSTSANISNEPSPANFKQVSPAIKERVDYIVKYRQEEEGEASASSIIKWNRSGPPTILRE
jgi:L-threonylcarbamoyladenylate synthase